MLLSTAIPIVIAAIVIIISKGISIKPIIPSIKKLQQIWYDTDQDKVRFLNKTKNIAEMLA